LQKIMAAVNAAIISSVVTLCYVGRH